MLIKTFIETDYKTLSMDFRQSISETTLSRIKHRLYGLNGVVMFKRQKYKAESMTVVDELLREDNNDIATRIGDLKEVVIMPLGKSRYLKVEKYNIENYRGLARYNDPKDPHNWHIITVYF